MASTPKAPAEPEQFPVINDLETPKPDGVGGQFAVIPDDGYMPPVDDCDASSFRMFRD